MRSRNSSAPQLSGRKLVSEHGQATAGCFLFHLVLDDVPVLGEFAILESDCVGQTRCLILDIAMPGMSGPDLQRELTLRKQEIPIVYITAHGDETVRPRLLEQGAVECLLKPFSDTALREALNAALRAS
jgi:CheY-like chemotaxis protein